MSLIQIELEAKQRRAAAMHDEVVGLQQQLEEAEALAEVRWLACWLGGLAGWVDALFVTCCTMSCSENTATAWVVGDLLQLP